MPEPLETVVSNRKKATKAEAQTAQKNEVITAQKAISALKSAQERGEISIGIYPTISGNIGDKYDVVSKGIFTIKSGTTNDGRKWTTVLVETNKGSLTANLELLESPRCNAGGKIPVEVVENNYTNKQGKEINAKKLVVSL